MFRFTGGHSKAKAITSPIHVDASGLKTKVVFCLSYGLLLILAISIVNTAEPYQESDLALNMV